jgi:adenosine kinase
LPPQPPNSLRAELITFIEQATYIAVNDYESQMLQDKTNLSLSEIASMVKALVITKGAKGSEIHTNNEIINIGCFFTYF